MLQGGAGLNEEMIAQAREVYRFSDSDIEFLRKLEEKPVVILALHSGDSPEIGRVAALSLLELASGEASVVFRHTGCTVPISVKGDTSSEDVETHFKRYSIHAKT